MSEITIKQYICLPNSTEIGKANTHESYIKVMEEDRDAIKKTFPIDKEFDVKDEQNGSDYCLKITDGGELRIVKLGVYYREHRVEYGDEVIITSLSTENKTNYYIKTINHNRVIFNFIKSGYEIINLERLDRYKQGNGVYSFNANVEGNAAKLEITYSGKEKKRKDSPTPTDVYKISENGIKFSKSFFLEIEGNSINYFKLMNPKHFEDVKVDSNIFNQFNSNSKIQISKNSGESIQKIYYGAPGTGKSHFIDKYTESHEVIRTTFHPDTDYSSFVGAYKPTTTKVHKYSLDGSRILDADGDSVLEEKITYEFIPQSFLKAYVSAWKKLAQVSDDETEEKVYLIIEEINRGNCAQIFGDIFQLLDRDLAGFSKYHIESESDIQKYLENAFNGITVQKSILTAEILKKVLNGKILLLPNNLFIWATMNTSDQSLFPIDSAFKRRWDWSYVPIHNAKKNWKIKIENNLYDWWNFLEKINEKIELLTNSEDKKLGYFFCKPKDNNYISEDEFVGKVVFYLWNDVFKDYEFDDDIFKDENGSKLVFNKFYDYDGTKSIIKKDLVINFLSNLGVINESSLDNDLNEVSFIQSKG